MEDRISGGVAGGCPLALAQGASPAPEGAGGLSPDRPDSGSPDLASRCNGGSSKHLNSSSLSNGSTGENDFLEQRRYGTQPRIIDDRWSQVITGNDLTFEINFRSAGNGTVVTNGDAHDETEVENKSINRSNSKSVTGGRDTSRKGRDGDKKNDKDNGKDNLSLVIKLESDVKRLKCDLQLSRNRENELRDQIVSYMSSKLYHILMHCDVILSYSADERGLKSEISSLLVDKSQLEARINGLIKARGDEKQTLSSLEKKLAEEKKARSDFQVKLETERKNKKEAVKAELTAAQQSAKEQTLQKLEIEIGKLRDELARTEQRANSAEEEIMGLRKNGENDKLMMQLKKAKEKEDKLRDSLSDETKIKMDLFSALGVAKRDLQIREHMLCEKDREILDLKAAITEFLAVGSSNSISNFMTSMGVSNGGGGAAPMSAAPGSAALGFPATTRTTSASSGLFTPYNHHDNGADSGEQPSVLDLPAGTELSRLAGLGLDSLEATNTR